MCDFGIAMAALSTTLGIASSMSSASAQAEQYENNAKAATQATVNSYAGLGLRQRQEQAKAAVEQFDIGLQMAGAKSSARASAGETGTAEGVSFESLLRDYEARGGRALDTSDANYEMTRDAIQSEKDASLAKGQMAINSMPRPSPMGLFADVGAKLAMGGLKIYDITDRSLMKQKTPMGA
jgi:hypothetical protein